MEKEDLLEFVQELMNEEFEDDVPLLEAFMCHEDGFVAFANVLHSIGDGVGHQIETAFQDTVVTIDDTTRDWLVDEADRPIRWLAAKAREVSA